MVMADTDLTPFDMGTFGSLTTPQMAPQLRKAAASARMMLVKLAAAKWNVDASKLTARDGFVSDANGHRASYGELSKGEKLLETIEADVALTPAAEWQIAGTSVPKINGRDFVTGRHQYASDIVRPSMLFGRVVRPEAFGATLVRLDSAKVPKGVTVVHEGDFAGVIAPTPEEADSAASAIRAEWKSEPQPSSKELFPYLRANAGTPRTIHEAGSVQDALANAPVKLKQTYQIAYIAHTPLEPRAAVAEWSGDRLTVWTGTQRPFGVRGELAEAFHLPEERIRVIVPDTGSGYGGKHTGEAAIEAARLAKSAGKPVKLVWTREEEFTWAYARPAGVIDVVSGATKDGRIVAWEFHNYNSGTAGIETMYTVPNQRIEFHETKSPLRQGSYRALASTANHFARESHINELADELGMDPLEFRLKNLADPRLKAAFTTAAEGFGWGGKPAAGHGYGIAGGYEKRGYVAAAVEVSVEKGRVRILRVSTAFDCGAVVNPEHLKNQVEGAMVMGIGGALFEALEFSNGQVTNAHLSDYRVPRFSDLPVLKTVLIDRKDQPSMGAGECPIIGLAPAVAAAIFQATGERRRSLPMV